MEAVHHLRGGRFVTRAESRNDFLGLKLKPDHETHENGRHLDGWFDGYNARNGATADKMIDYLNDPDYGSHIKTVYVTFSKSGGNTSFWNAIKDVELDDGRMAKDVILPLSNHDTHFHWIIY